MEIEYPKQSKGKDRILKELKMSEEQRSWYEIGYMCGYAKAMDKCKGVIQ